MFGIDLKMVAVQSKNVSCGTKSYQSNVVTTMIDLFNNALYFFNKMSFQVGIASANYDEFLINNVT